MDSRFKAGDIIAEKNWIGHTTQYVVIDTIFSTHILVLSQHGFSAAISRESESQYAKIGYVSLKPLLEQVAFSESKVSPICETDKTCVNCKHYHLIVGDLEQDCFWHMHNYCDLWKKEIPSSVIFDDVGYDDIERGIACCWAFEGRQSEFKGD